MNALVGSAELMNMKLDVIKNSRGKRKAWTEHDFILANRIPPQHARAISREYSPAFVRRMNGKHIPPFIDAEGCPTAPKDGSPTPRLEPTPAAAIALVFGAAPVLGPP